MLFVSDSKLNISKHTFYRLSYMIYNLNLATKITFLRILLTPYIVVTIFNQQWMIASMLSLIAITTDFLDGYCARYYHQETEFGKILDPVADKIFIFATLWALHYIFGNNVIPTWFMVFLAIKEFVLMVGALFLLKNNYQIITPSLFAKIMTALMMFLVLFLMMNYCFGIYFFVMDHVVVNVCKVFAICTIGISIDYGYKFYKIIQKS